MSHDNAASKRPHLKRYRQEAKRLLRAIEAGDEAALARLSAAGGLAANHTSCLHVVAKEAGFRSWSELLEKSDDERALKGPNR